MSDFAQRQKAFMLAGGQTVDRLNLDQAHRYRIHIVEEVDELCEALFDFEREGSLETLVKVLDAVSDLKVVANGLAWSLGVNPSDVDKAVADANDRKLVGGKVYRREDGQIGKPPGWVGPEAEIEEIVKRVQIS